MNYSDLIKKLSKATAGEWIIAGSVLLATVFVLVMSLLFP
jgi:hypothetical protein